MGIGPGKHGQFISQPEVVVVQNSLFKPEIVKYYIRLLMNSLSAIRLFLGLTGILALTGVPVIASETYQASVAVDVSHPLGVINPNLYGQFLEHVMPWKECVYPSIWDDKSRFADAMGLRSDVVEAVRGQGVPIVRWPGGCFADDYHWENGIGPRSSRPTLPNRYWGGSESNQFGTDEFLQWCQLIGAKPYINVNLGSGTLDEALRWLEYCNGSTDTPQGKRRADNGHPAPYDVPYWGIGNETWGDTEIGKMKAGPYAAKLEEWAAAMRKQDPAIKILAVGSNEGADPGWDRAVLTHAGSLVDYLTLHLYGSSTNSTGKDYEAVVFSSGYFDFRIRLMLKNLDDIQAQLGLKQPVQIALDEWAIRHYRGGNIDGLAPRNMEDTVFASGVLNVLLRHSSRIGMANYVLVVNGNSPLRVNADTVVKTPLYYLFQQYGRWMRGHAVAVDEQGPTCHPPPPFTGYGAPNTSSGYNPGEMPYLDCAAVLHDDGSLVIALINRHPTDAAQVSLHLPAGYTLEKSWTLQAENAYAVNDFAHPDQIVPVEAPVKEPTVEWRCPPHSVIMLFCAKSVQPGA